MKETLLEKINQTPKPMAIFDLDGTLFDVRHRTLEIMKRFSKELADHPQYNQEPDYQEFWNILEKLSHEHILYSVKRTMAQHAIDSEHPLLRQLIDYWLGQFFTNELVLFDQAYPLAVDTVKWFLNQGVHVTYLSGRDRPGMELGTIQSLQESGFPVPDKKQVHLSLKPNKTMDDVLFKKQVLEDLSHEWNIVFTADNEPANVKMFLETLPQALHVHFDSDYHQHMYLEGKHLWTIEDFRELNLV